MKKRFAIFDLDRTITTFPTFTPFLLSTRKSLAARAALLARFSDDLLAYKFGRSDRKALKNTMLSDTLSGFSAQFIAERANAFVDRTMKRGLRSQALDAIARHKAAGDCLVMATASVDFYATLFADRLDFDMCVSTQTNFSEDLAGPPVIIGPNCYGQDKADLLAAALRERTGLNRADQHLLFYSDHHSDFVSLQEVDEPFVVSPDRKTKAKALKQNFPILDW